MNSWVGQRVAAKSACALHARERAGPALHCICRLLMRRTRRRFLQRANQPSEQQNLRTRLDCPLLLPPARAASVNGRGLFFWWASGSLQTLHARVGCASLLARGPALACIRSLRGASRRASARRP